MIGMNCKVIPNRKSPNGVLEQVVYAKHQTLEVFSTINCNRQQQGEARSKYTQPHLQRRSQKHETEKGTQTNNDKFNDRLLAAEQQFAASQHWDDEEAPKGAGERGRESYSQSRDIKHAYTCSATVSWLNELHVSRRDDIGGVGRAPNQYRQHWCASQNSPSALLSPGLP